jgi:DNA-binding sugar fermentation-stimulating protein
MLPKLYTIDDLIEGSVIKRPSKFCKTPYVADILPVNSGTEVLGHTASLGCCGLADQGSSILMAPITKSNKKQTCQYSIFLSIIREPKNEKIEEIIVGIHPKLAEELVEIALKNNLLNKLQYVKRYKRETSIYVEGKVDSRFDFSGIDENGTPFIMEVKNVPLADYEDISAKDKKLLGHDPYHDRKIDTKVAYFPDGYRKKTSDPVSPRALKHIRELTLIKKQSKTRCIMCYVIQRPDVNRFQPSIIDPEYREAIKEGIEAGVEIITMVVKWTLEGHAYFVRDDLPITPFE